MPPHEALVISNVLDHIFGYFVVDPESPEDVDIKVHLLWAALSCRAFSRPALNALWRTLDSLLPLLELLPSLKWVDNDLVLRGPIQDEDWTRFDNYARRVKEFVCHQDHGGQPAVDPSVYFYIAQSRTSPLLPTLRRFRCVSSASTIPNILLFLSPYLNEVEFVMNDTRQQELSIGGFLSVLKSVAPSLKHLEIDGVLSTSSLASVVHLEHLRSLRLWKMGRSVDTTLLKKLGALEQLSGLTIDLAESGIFYTNTFNRGEGFKALETLDISGHLEAITGALQMISTDRLTSISISSSSFDDHFFEALLFEMIALRWSDTLRSLVVYDPTAYLRVYMDYPRDSEAIFEHLSALSQLEHLQVENIPFPRLTDEDIRILMSALPEIKSLTLPCAGRNCPTTIFALHPIAEFCPHLKYLKMPIGTHNLSPFSVTPVFSHGLETLHVSNSTAGDPSLLARHLDRLFPHLQSIEAHRNLNEWREVENLVHMCQDVRFHAREQSRE